MHCNPIGTSAVATRGIWCCSTAVLCPIFKHPATLDSILNTPSFAERLSKHTYRVSPMLSTPARQRSSLSQSRPPTSARTRGTPRTSTATELPPYEAPEAPLTIESQRQVAAFLQSQHLRHLKTHLSHATEKLTDSAGEVNDRLSDARSRYETNKERRRNADEDNESDEPDEEFQRLGEIERQADNVTGRMEERMRQMIDSQSRLSNLTDSLQTIEREEGEAHVAALGARQTRAQRRRQQHRNDEEDGEEDPHDEDYEGTPEREARELNARHPPSKRLADSLADGAQKWDGLSLTER